LNAAEVCEKSPEERFLQEKFTSSVWCPGCGIGTVINSFFDAIEENNVFLDDIRIVSGIGCTGESARYLNLRSHKISDASVIAYASELAYENPDLKVIAITNNADFLLSGAGDFIEAGKKNANILALHVNNLIYCVTENGVLASTPFMRSSNDFDLPFNIPNLARSAGAVYIARWTPHRAGWLRYAIIEGLSIQGLSVVEVVSPCVVYSTSDNRLQDPVDRMNFYTANSVIRYNEPTERLDLRSNDKIIIGRFTVKKED